MQAVSSAPRALLLYGGWEGHEPEKHADFALRHLLGDFNVTPAQNLDVLKSETLRQFDLLLPIWTFGEIDAAHAFVDDQCAAIHAIDTGGGYERGARPRQRRACITLG